MSFYPPPPQKKKLNHKLCNILIVGRAGPGRKTNLRAGPEISARLTPLLHKFIRRTISLVHKCLYAHLVPNEFD